MSKLIREIRDPISAKCAMLQLQIHEWKLSGVSQKAPPKSLHVVGFTRTKSPGFLSIKWFNITAACHFNIIPIKVHSASISRDWSDARLSPTTGKSQVWWRAFGQPRSAENPKHNPHLWQKRPSIDGSGTDWTAGQSRTVATTPSVSHARPANEGCPSIPCSLSLERTTLLHSVILWLLWLGPVFCLAPLHLEGSKAAEMCTTDGRNYLAHLTSEIFFPPFSSLSPFSTNYSKTGEIDRFVQVGLELESAIVISF